MSSRKSYILYRRASGGKGGKVWYVAFWSDDQGKYVSRRSTGKTTAGDADRQARRWLEEGPAKSGEPAFLDYLDRFWADGSDYLLGREARGHRLSKMYVGSARSGLRRYVRPYVEANHKSEIGISEINAALLEALLMHLKGLELSPSRANGIMKAIRVPLSYAYRMGLIRENPGPRVQRLPEQAPRRQILTLDEAKRFFLLEWKDRRCYAANLTAALGGLRMGEIRGLQIDDILDAHLHVCHNWIDREGMKGPKHSTQLDLKWRDVPIPAKLEYVLRQTYADNPWGDRFVFWGPRSGKPISSTSLGDSYICALKAIGIEETQRRDRNLTFHAWRHWYRSMLDSMGLSARAGDDLTGHTGEAIAKRYTHITEEQRKAVAAVAEQTLT